MLLSEIQVYVIVSRCKNNEANDFASFLIEPPPKTLVSDIWASYKAKCFATLLSDQHQLLVKLLIEKNNKTNVFWKCDF